MRNGTNVLEYGTGHAVSEYCPGLPGLGEYLEGLGEEYSENLLRLHAACSHYGWEQMRENRIGGLFAVLGDPADVERVAEKKHYSEAFCSEMVRRYGKRILMDPESTRRFLSEAGKGDVDGTMVLDLEGSLAGVRWLRDDVMNGDIHTELRHIMRFKGKSRDSVGGKHKAALSATYRHRHVEGGINPMYAVATSENGNHTTIVVEGGSVLQDLVFSAHSGRYGLDLINSLDDEEMEGRI